MSDYEVMICPVCMKQVEYGGYEEPTGHYHDEYAGIVQPVTVPASVDPHKLHAACIKVSGTLREQKDEESKRRKEREDWDALPQAEKDRILAERWAAMSTEEKAFSQMVDGMRADLSRSLNRQAFGETTDVPVRESAKIHRP